MKKIFTFIVLSIFIFASIGCGAVSWNQKKKWPKAPTLEELQQRQKKQLSHSELAKNPASNTLTSRSFTAVQDDTIQPQMLKVYLKPSMVELCPDQQKQVLNWLGTIENFRKQCYIIKGYTDDSIDPKKSNQKYAEERAINTKKFLMQQGITAGQINIIDAGGIDSAKISRGKKRRVEITKRRFDKDIPLIPEPEEEYLSDNDSRLTSLSEPAKYPDWNKFPAGYNRVGSNLIVIGWKRIDNNTFDVIITLHESLIPEGATQFMPLGIGENWKKGNAVFPTPMWKETLQAQPAMFRRNLFCRDKKNKDLGYADINQAYRAGDTWAVKNSDVGMEKNKKDNSCCIGFFLGQNGLKSIP